MAMETVPRPEYPRPQFVRDQWLCLNGEWQFEIDAGNSGRERGLIERDLSGSIIVPFCPESQLSGIENTDFLNAVWYRRAVTIPKEWKGKSALLHFQACDYDTTVWVNGAEVVRHRGGFTPFCANMEGVAKAGDTITIVVRARDTHGEPKPRGKQSQRYENHACLYTRTTGIWQTVWMEPVAKCHMKRPRLTPNVARGTIRVQVPLSGNAKGLTLRCVLRDERGQVAKAQVAADADFAPEVELNIPEARRRLWSIKDPFLYDLSIELLDAKGAVVDSYKSYAGLRSVTIDGKAIKLNGQTVFQRLVLDQGYYSDGIMTAPSEAALVADIQMSLDAGFNGARLHQKVFEERFLYHCDRMGYIVWGEFPDWGSHNVKWQHDVTFSTQWSEAVERDYSHPAIVGWCPLNETWEQMGEGIETLDDSTRALFLATKAIDQTRPVLDTSGYSHRVPETDVYDCHDYEQVPEKFAANQAPLAEGKPFQNGPKNQTWNVPYRGQPFFVSEFGGIWWRPGTDISTSWGYGERPKTIEEFYERFEGLCNALLDDPNMFGYCYTQLTDVFLEENGIYTFERGMKFDLKKLKKVQTRKAAIEKKK